MIYKMKRVGHRLLLWMSSADVTGEKQFPYERYVVWPALEVSMEGKR